MASAAVPWSARTVRRFFETLNEAPAARMRERRSPIWATVHAGIVGDDHGAGFADQPVEACDDFRLPGTIHTRHFGSPFNGSFGDEAATL